MRTACYSPRGISAHFVRVGTQQICLLPIKPLGKHSVPVPRTQNQLVHSAGEPIGQPRGAQKGQGRRQGRHTGQKRQGFRRAPAQPSGLNTAVPGFRSTGVAVQAEKNAKDSPTAKALVQTAHTPSTTVVRPSPMLQTWLRQHTHALERDCSQEPKRGPSCR